MMNSLNAACVWVSGIFLLETLRKNPEKRGFKSGACRAQRLVQCWSLLKTSSMQISFDLSRELVIALWAEFLGTFIFQFFGGTEQVGPVNGVVLTVCIYMTAKYSGGNLNPAVSAGLCLTGVLPPFKAGLYAVAQISGSIVAALIAAFIDLDENLDAAGLGNWGEYKEPYLIPPGCHRTLPDRARGSVFMLEMLGTFVLVATVHATAVAKPGFGDHAPFAIGTWQVTKRRRTTRSLLTPLMTLRDSMPRCRSRDRYSRWRRWPHYGRFLQPGALHRPCPHLRLRSAQRVALPDCAASRRRTRLPQSYTPPREAHARSTRRQVGSRGGGAVRAADEVL